MEMNGYIIPALEDSQFPWLIIPMVVGLTVAISGAIVLSTFKRAGWTTMIVGAVLFAFCLLAISPSGREVRDSQARTIEQGTGFADVQINKGKFTASDNGRPVSGRLIKDGDEYIVILDN